MAVVTSSETKSVIGAIGRDDEHGDADEHDDGTSRRRRGPRM
jgi:hypothetical protein